MYGEDEGGDDDEDDDDDVDATYIIFLLICLFGFCPLIFSKYLSLSSNYHFGHRDATTAITNDLDHHTIKVFAIAGGLEAEESLAQQAYNSLHRLVSERSHTLNLSLCTRNQKKGLLFENVLANDSPHTPLELS